MSDKESNENETTKSGVVLETSEIEESEIEKLKGGTVGETLYSSKWIINSLLSLSKVHEDGWNEKTESDLCTLWDMTTEKDIVLFLVKNDFFKIAEFTLNAAEEPRLTEIVLGIIGNITCEPEVLELLAGMDGLVQTILRHLSSEDSATLVQILRLLRSTLWSIQNDAESKWRSNLRNSIFLREVVPFILKSSTNEELLIATTNFLRSSAEIDLPSGTLMEELFEGTSLLSGLLESFEEVLPEEEAHYSTTILKYLEDWLELFSILRKRHEILREILREDSLPRTIEIPRRVLTNFVDPWNLFPLDEIKASSVHRCVETILDFRWKGFVKADNTTDVDRAILRIIFNIHSVADEEKLDDEDHKETMETLLKYLEGYWIEIAKISSDVELANVLKTGEKDSVDHAINLLRKKITSEKLNNLIDSLSREQQI